MADAELTPQEIIDQIPAAFQADKAQGLAATFQFDITGPQGGQWYTEIKDSQCQVTQGISPAADITITIADENFVRLITGRLDGTMAFMTGKLKLKGDMGLAMRLSGLFKLPDKA
ncbi:MAG TPA: SCP2 sterol-binding domain-containing protein [Candidatus Dormibacteraeota bacterium]|nr:SCP2 sterol-binding domain-containing protein [Candidatus Dormibacteraeota bacterium]